MGRKIFVSYKYKDDDVKLLNSDPDTTVRNYVDYLEDKLLGDHIYKGEGSDEDLSSYSEDYIWNHLKDKIYGSTITIVLISPNMKEPRRWQESQWIPWEILYSLRETTRNDRTSHNNAILAVILPDKSGSYDYYYNKKDDLLFPILKDNIRSGYIFVVKWENFKKDHNRYIDEAFECRDHTPDGEIKKSL